MTKVNFTYDIKKDSWSWVLIAKDKNVWGLDWRQQIAHISNELLEKIEKVDFNNAQGIVEDYIKTNSKTQYKNKVMLSEIEALKKSWNEIEDDYMNILSKVTQKSIFTQNIQCYFTTGLMCPYNDKENWFMVSMWHSIPFSITTVCHEILHLQFLHYYREYLISNGLTNTQIEDIKESLTFLLNEFEFDKIILCQDNGYPEHCDFRNKLKDIWSTNKDFKNLIDQSILLLKNGNA
ncbi:MAG: hypothetical protein WCO30_01060 [bacterium]